GALECVGLRNGARKTVKQVTIGAIRLFQAVLYEANDDVVRYQAACVHYLFGFQAERRAGFDSRAQHVAGGNLRNGELLGDESSLSAFAGTGRTKQNETHGRAPE